MIGKTEELSAAFGRALLELGRVNERVVVLDSDIADSCQTEAFRNAFPNRSFDLGVAEQSLPTFAAGLALCGKIPICNSFGVFSATRGFDMIRQSVCYNRANVKIVAHAAGQSMGYTGPSHHTVEDISALRALPYMAILSPCDGVEVTQVVRAMAEHEGPVYLRLARVSVPHLHGDGYRFRMGKLDRLAEGSDVTLFATGDLVHLALEARSVLADQGVRARVVNVPCLKPLESEEVAAQGADTLGAVTIEDHNVLGGLGGIISEIYSGSICKPVLRVGIPDVFTESDDCEKLRKKVGISIDSIENCVHLIVERTQQNAGRTAARKEGAGQQERACGERTNEGF